MENVSLSLPHKRIFSSSNAAAYTSHKSVYDDVFGGNPKLGLPTLAPRLEDYSEIFGGFHAAAASSIPLLHLPPLHSDLHFEVRSPAFEYAEVFEYFRGLDFTASSDELVGGGQSSPPSRGYHSSASSSFSNDDPWSPAQSGTLSDELDPLAGSNKSYRLSDNDVQQSSESIKQLSSSYNMPSGTNMETLLAAASQITNFGAVPGYTFSRHESPVSWDGQDEQCSFGFVDHINNSKEIGARLREEKQFKCSSNSLHSGFDTHRNDCTSLEKHGNSTSPLYRPFVSVCDISLRTKPSRLPPPSRPPPVLVVKEGECDRSNSKLNVNAFERVENDGEPPFFVLEMDAHIFSEGQENGNKNVKVKHQSNKEPSERSDARSRGAVELEEKTNKTVRVSSGIEAENLRQTHKKDTTVSFHEERIEPVKSTKQTSGSAGVQYRNCGADGSAEALALREATQYFEVIEKNSSRQAFDTVEACDTSMQLMSRGAHIHQGKTYGDTFKVTEEGHRWELERNKSEMTREHFEQHKEVQNTRLSSRKGCLEKLIPNKQPCAYNLNKKIPENLLQLGECEKLQIDHSETLESQLEAKGNVNEVGAKLVVKGSRKRMNIEKRLVESQITKQNSEMNKENIIREELQRRLEDMEGAETREIAKERTEAEGNERQHAGISQKLNDDKLEETYKLIENDMILMETKKHREYGEKSYIAAGDDKKGTGHLALEKDKDAGKLIVNELISSVALGQVGNKKEHESDVIEERNKDVSKTDDNILRFRMVGEEAGNKEVVFETTGIMKLSEDAGLQVGLIGHGENFEPIERNEHEREVEYDLDSQVLMKGGQIKVLKGEYKVDKVIATNVLGKHDTMQMLELTQAAFSSERSADLETELKCRTYESETGMADKLLKARFDKFRKNKDGLQYRSTHSDTNNTVEFPCLPNQMPDSNICGNDMRTSCVMPVKISSALENRHEQVKIIFGDDDGGQKMNSVQFISKRVDRENSNQCQVIREAVVSRQKMGDASLLLKHNDDTLFSITNSTSQLTDRKGTNMKDNPSEKGPIIGERIRKETAPENEHAKKIEEMERVREREKDRMTVDKAALEAGDRSFSEARERAERAAVARGAAEVRQRAMADARERLEKASMKARLRVERASVGATVEAWQQAAEKLMAQKAAYDTHDQVEFVPDKFSASSRSYTSQSFLSSELHFQSTAISNGLRYSYSSAHDRAEGESPQRSKARLERYRRTAERAANALAEKNRRDLLEQREREERNRIAEALDAEVKRWSSGKEGNLRALLSTLQYILGPDSGWHPVPLTEVITSAAVKKVYRKATLCVHPDKLQQRGATIQQKYISEKVFDLLKEAWNKFNSEER